MVSNSSVTVLSNGFAIGATLVGGYNWEPVGWASRSMLSYNSSIGDFLKNAGIGSNFIGFRFNIGAGLHYSWAEVIIGSGALTTK